MNGAKEAAKVIVDTNMSSKEAIADARIIAYQYQVPVVLGSTFLLNSANYFRFRGDPNPSVMPAEARICINHERDWRRHQRIEEHNKTEH